MARVRVTGGQTLVPKPGEGGRGNVGCSCQTILHRGRETAEKVARKHVGHVSNVPSLSRFNLPTCQISPSWHVGNVPHDFFSSLPVPVAKRFENWPEHRAPLLLRTCRAAVEGGNWYAKSQSYSAVRKRRMVGIPYPYCRPTHDNRVPLRQFDRPHLVPNRPTCPTFVGLDTHLLQR